MSVALLKPGVDTEQAAELDGGNPHQYDGWYCIELGKKIKCSDCGSKIHYAEPDDCHNILVWEEMDEDDILNSAIALKHLLLDPRIKEYKVSMGKCETFESAKKRGKVVWVTPLAQMRSHGS